MINFYDRHPFWFMIVVFIVLMLGFLGLSLLLNGLQTGFKSYHFEYETVDGEKGRANFCFQPFREVPYCDKEDGTKIYGLKSYKKVIEE